MTTIKSYKELQGFLTTTTKALGVYDDVANAPHDIFWEQLNYHDFTTGEVPNVGGRILIPGKPEESLLISILKGPAGGNRRMPAGGPYFSDDQIASVADWIKRGCPEN